jgi:hypothetical protein
MLPWRVNKRCTNVCTALALLIFSEKLPSAVLLLIRVLHEGFLGFASQGSSQSLPDTQALHHRDEVLLGLPSRRARCLLIEEELLACESLDELIYHSILVYMLLSLVFYSDRSTEQVLAGAD